MKPRIVLPEAFLRCMSREDRARVRAGMTAEEFFAAGQAKNEQTLQKQIVGLLRLKGIEPLVPSFGKKTRMTKGWPDITFCIEENGNGAMYPIRWACLWEIKYGNGKLSPEQEEMHERLGTFPNDWRVKIIRSVDEALRELKLMGIK